MHVEVEAEGPRAQPRPSGPQREQSGEVKPWVSA